jgi:EmrB/QacA subfamily drug resistance transporter
MAAQPTATIEVAGRDAGSWIGHPNRRRILLVLCLSLLVVTVDNTILNTALPTLARSLGAGTSALQWIVDAYTLCFAGLLVTAGAIGDRFGRRLMLLAGLATFGLGSVAAAFASSSGMLISDRALMGLGAAFVMPATLSILNDVFPPSERAQAIAAWSAVAGVGIILGPTFGGLLLDHFWWGSVFLLNVPLVLGALLAVRSMVPESRGHDVRRLDLLGALSSVAALVTIVDAIIEAPSRGWSSPVTVALLVGGIGMLALFVAVELRAERPLIDVRIFRDRTLAAASASIGVTFFALFGSLFALTQYLQLVRGYSPLSAGLRALPFALAMGMTAPFSTQLADRLGRRVVVAVGLGLMGAGLFILSLTGITTPYPYLAAYTAVMGAGMGLVMAPASSAVMAAVPRSQAGAGSAVNDTVREVGGALGVAVIGSLVQAAYRQQVTAKLATFPTRVLDVIGSSVAAGDAAAEHVHGALRQTILLASHESFTSAMATGMRISGVIALAAGLVAALVLGPERDGVADAAVLAVEEVPASAAA